MASAALLSLLDAALGAMFDEAIEKVGDRLKQVRQRRALTRICADAIEASARTAPELAVDLHTDSFCSHVLMPIVIDLLANPTQIPQTDRLARDFVEMFVRRFAIDGDIDAALARIFRTDQATLVAASAALFEALRDGLARSDQWRDIVHLQVSLENQAYLKRLVEPRLALPAPVDTALAREDAWRASEDLRSWPRDIWGSQIERPEFTQVAEAIAAAPAGTTLLVGDAGTGKSAFMAALVDHLRVQGCTVFAIKADRLPPEVRSLDEIGRVLGMARPLVAELRALAAQGPVVLLIDQLDAVSSLMDRQSDRMRLLLELVVAVRGKGPEQPPVHVVISSRPFEAHHDARFQQLDAKRIVLHPPSRAQVEALLAELGILTAIPEQLVETIRRPFALKLFVDLVKRGTPVDDLLPAQLLTAWFNSIPLDADVRRDVVQLMTRLAEEMVRTESLWRPADRHELDDGPALAAALACGLIVREGDRIGFSHQSWLDDFQARNFVTGADLAAFAWAGQDSLFPRAAILRGLRRLRAVDIAAYLAAIDMLLGEARTRRHLRHLITDLLAIAQDPHPREVAWVSRLIEDDLVLARRALSGIARAWDGWRGVAWNWLPALARRGDLDWHMVAMLVAETQHDALAVAEWLGTHWVEASHDPFAALVIEDAKTWHPVFLDRVLIAIGRSSLDLHRIAHLMTTLRKAGRAEEALAIVEAHVRSRGGHDHLNLYEVEKLAEAEPVCFVRRLLPWFIELASSDVEPDRSYKDQFPTSQALGWDWDRHKQQGEVFWALRLALESAARLAPKTLYGIVEPYLPVEIEEVQSLLADALAAAGPALAGEAHAFLLADPRRFGIGDATGTSGDTIQTIKGWSARQLVAAIVPGLDDDQLVSLRDAILRWSGYSDETWAGFSASEKRMRLPWIAEARAPLLEPIPTRILGARRRRQIEEWRREQPVFRSINAISMMSAVPSPMSNAAMEKASDAQIRWMLDEVHDGVDDRPRRGSRRFSFGGGVIQLSQAFGAFAKARPERALTIIAGLAPGQHEHAAGAALREVASVGDPAAVAALIHQLDAKGFASPHWRNDCGWALQTVSARLNGLPDGDIALVERWLERAPATIARQIASRIELEQRNSERNAARRDTEVRQLLFGRGGGRVIVPQRNHTFLDTMGSGWLERDPPDHEAWMDAMLRHLDDPEDPAIWAFTLRKLGASLWWVDKDRAALFWHRLHDRHPETFDDLISLGTVWQLLDTIPTDVRNRVFARWLQGAEPLPQMAGEILGALVAQGRADAATGMLVAQILVDGGGAKTGFLFSLAEAWHTGDQDMRELTHPLLLAHMEQAEADDATAIAITLGRYGAIPADRMTREMLVAVAASPPVLNAAMGHFLLEMLQRLLLHPGFDEPVLAFVEQLLEAALNGGARRRSTLDSDMVEVAVALQRNDGPLRVRAMDLYEKLLDAAVYGAEEAAQAAMRR